MESHSTILGQCNVTLEEVDGAGQAALRLYCVVVKEAGAIRDEQGWSAEEDLDSFVAWCTANPLGKE
jgi:hypothetical protein